MKAMFTVRRSSLRVPKVILGAMLIFGMWTALLGTPAKAGGVGSSALITIGPSSQSHAAGSAQTYDIALSCAGVGGASCGPNIQITIPLSSATTPAMVDPRWKYSATSGTAGLVSSGPTVSGNNLLLTVNPALFVAGYSGTIRLSVTPPNSVTPNNTSWSLTPSIDSDAISPVTAPNPAASTATAKPQTSISKSTSDGGSVYQVNGTVTYYLDAKCTTPSTGNLFVSTASIVDTLPAGVTYVSSTPAGAVVSGQTVTWEFSDASPSTMPAGCSAGASGVTRYEITATAPPTAAGNLRNTATFAGTGPDATNPSGVTSTSTAQNTIATVSGPPIGPGIGYASITKTALAPLAQAGVTSGNQYIATYAGNWVPLSSAPSYTVGAAAASYQTTVTYGLVGTYESSIYDPVPCLSNPLGGAQVGFGSNSYTGATCTSPAFHTQYFTAYSPGYDATVNGLGRAYDAGWRPIVVLTDGSTHGLDATAPVSSSASTANFAIPAGYSVAMVILPPDPALKNKTLRLTMFGYTDSSLENLNSGVNEIQNTATVVPHYSGCPAGDCAPRSYPASVFTVPARPTLGISKAFGTRGGGPNGTTVLNLKGSVASATTLSNDVVLADLLPTLMTWSNPVSSANFSIQQAGGTSTLVSATITHDANYQGSGRELIRIRIPLSAFPHSGTWTITPPTNLLLVNVPSTPPALYANTDQIFLFNYAPAQINPACNTPTQTNGFALSTATFENANPMDLAGDGKTSENYCQNSASLTVSGTGAAFALTKTVQGDLDAVPRGALGVGTVSPTGFATYGLTWTNVGSDSLNNVVIYDLLPALGDGGVSEGQAPIPRDSQFAPYFVGLGSLPQGVTAEYSQASNPCRDDVFLNSNNPGCVDDWSASPPFDLTTVTGLRFVATGTFAFGQGFQLSITVQIPSGVYNQTAWNSAATNASDVTSPSTIPLPAEPPKVGIRTTSPPNFVSTVSNAVTTAYEPLSDQIAVQGLGTSVGEVDWTLYGPLTPVNGACAGLDWSSAPIDQSGHTRLTNGDETYTIGPADVGAIGCYTWGYSIIDADYSPLPSIIDPGQPGEITLVNAHDPQMSTTAEGVDSSTSGAYLLRDSVRITASGIGIAPQAPSSAVLTWTLYGPIASNGGSCAGLNWAQAPQVATGTIQVTGDGTYLTPQTSVTQHGCYSFSEALSGHATRNAVFQAAGIAEESIIVPTPGSIAYTGSFTIPAIILGVVFVGLGGLLLGLRRRAKNS